MKKFFYKSPFGSQFDFTAVVKYINIAKGFLISENGNRYELKEVSLL